MKLTEENKKLLTNVGIALAAYIVVIRPLFQKLGIVKTQEIIEHNGNFSNMLNYFNTHKKKDDLADVVMQTLSFLPSKDKKVEKATQVKKVSARKPNQHQKESKYSRSNLAWLIKNDGKDKCLSNKRFLRDLKKYYSSVEQLIKAIG